MFQAISRPKNKILFLAITKKEAVTNFATASGYKKKGNLSCFYNISERLS